MTYYFAFTIAVFALAFYLRALALFYVQPRNKQHAWAAAWCLLCAVTLIFMVQRSWAIARLLIYASAVSEMVLVLLLAASTWVMYYLFNELNLFKWLSLSVLCINFCLLATASFDLFINTPYEDISFTIYSVIDVVSGPSRWAIIFSIITSFTTLIVMVAIAWQRYHAPSWRRRVFLVAWGIFISLWCYAMLFLLTDATWAITASISVLALVFTYTTQYYYRNTLTRDQLFKHTFTIWPYPLLIFNAQQELVQTNALGNQYLQQENLVRQDTRMDSILSPAQVQELVAATNQDKIFTYVPSGLESKRHTYGIAAISQKSENPDAITGWTLALYDVTQSQQRQYNILEQTAALEQKHFKLVNRIVNESSQS